MNLLIHSDVRCSLFMDIAYFFSSYISFVVCFDHFVFWMLQSAFDCCFQDMWIKVLKSGIGFWDWLVKAWTKVYDTIHPHMVNGKKNTHTHHSINMAHMAKLFTTQFVSFYHVISIYIVLCTYVQYTWTHVSISMHCCTIQCPFLRSLPYSLMLSHRNDSVVHLMLILYIRYICYTAAAKARKCHLFTKKEEKKMCSSVRRRLPWIGEAHIYTMTSMNNLSLNCTIAFYECAWSQRYKLHW